MWAAANDDDARRRRSSDRNRRHPDEQRRRSSTAADDDDDDDDDGQHATRCDYDGDSDSTTAKPPHHNSLALRHGHSIHGSSGINEGDDARWRRRREKGGKRKRRQHDAAEEGIVSDNKKRQKKNKRQIVTREETPEATVSRLQASYSTSMAAVGALHRLSHQLCALLRKKNAGEHEAGEDTDNVTPSATNDMANDRPPQDDNETCDEGDASTDLASLKRVAQAARCAFERSLLLDPVLLTPVFLPPNSAATINDKKKKNAVVHGGIRSSMNVHIIKDMRTVPSSAWLDTWNGFHVSREDSDSATTAAVSNRVVMQSATKWIKFSEAQRRVIRQVSYLALVNYADLLLCGCLCHRHCAQSNAKDVLDRGAVSNLQALRIFPSSFNTAISVSGQETIMTDDMNSTPRVIKRDCRHSQKCLWLDDEPAQKTVRLALAAYCDASEVDPTDPTLWFKLACAARALGRMVDFPSSSSSSSSSSSDNEKITDVIPPPPRSYRSLERLSLERGLSALPRGVPPNRMLARAWKEMEDWDREGCFVNQIEDDTDHLTMDDYMTPDENPWERAERQPTELVLHLPRYSWVTLCRILVQASKEGASYRRSPPPGGVCRVPHVWSTNCQLSEDYEFGSPLVDVRLSPLLGVPLHVFGIMCAYMEESDVKKLVGTCRAMPTTVAAATEASMSNATVTNDVSTRNDTCFERLTGETAAEEEIRIGLDTETKAASIIHQEINTVPRRGRISKRVRSQLITTERQAERKSKRSSVEYCLLAGVLSCTAHNPFYTKMLKANQPAVSRTSVEGSGSNRSPDARLLHPGFVNASCSPASLNEFIHRWSRRNSGPRNVLHHLLTHISLNIAEVFEEESTSTLSSCVIDCFDAITSSVERSAIGTNWYGAETFVEAGDLDTVRTVYAVNLLNAELRYMRCESRDFDSNDQKDSSFLAFVIPNLLLFASESSKFGSCQQIVELRIRTYWLACLYYFWVGRCTDTSIAKAAEDIAFNYLSIATQLFSDNSLSHSLKIKTPHLMSSDRRGDHWHEISADLLAKYKKHIHSSAIVSQARQYFQEAQLKIKESDHNLEADVYDKLAMLGSDLFERFNVSSDNSKENVDDLLSDFRMIHEEDLFPTDDSVSAQSTKTIWDGEGYWGRIWMDIPSSVATLHMRENMRPSIIQVLATSLLTSNEKAPSLLFIFLKVASAALSQFALAFLQGRPDQNVEFTDDNDYTTIDIHSRREYSLLRIANFFGDKMTDIITSITDDNILHHALETCMAGDEVICIFIVESFNSLLIHQMGSREAILYAHHIKSISRLVQSVRNSQPLTREYREKIESVYFVALLKAIIRLKVDFVYLKSSTTDKRTKKWQSQVASKADIVFILASEVAELLSLNPSIVCANGTTRKSHLINALQDIDATEESYSVLAQFSEALLWFWEFLHDTTPANILMVPISSLIIALCGSHGASVERAICKVDEGSDRGILSLSDYFDSEESVNGSFLPGDSSEDEDQKCRRLTLRKICQLVQCTSIVFHSIDHKLIEQSCPSFPSSYHGPFLPLIMVRVLSSMSKGLFHLFSQDIGGEAYPFGARECGATIDRLLGKAYRFLHGFSFSSSDSGLSNNYAPESIEAALSVFHCIKRVYRDSRKASPPSKAFEVIALALPAADESSVSIAIKNFLFNADKDYGVDIHPLPIHPNTLPSGFPEWVFDAESHIFAADESQNKIELLRRGVAHELAKGSMHNFHSPEQLQDDAEDKCVSAERELTQNHELRLYQKFRAVLNDLCYDPKNIERWVVLSECLGFKADMICDRLVPVQDLFDSSEFGLNVKSKKEDLATMSLDQLKMSQLNIFTESRSKNWQPFLGNSLHVYMQCPWSNLTSLEACAKEVGSSITQIDENDVVVSAEDCINSDYLCWKEIESQFVNEKYASWANSWGCLFVTALRKMRLKALLVARHLARNSQEGMHPSEVCEDLGTALYGELMASTVYGYPMHIMSLHEKRTIAKHSNTYFQEAIELSTCMQYPQKCHIKPFESYFMIGKGHEKIASTLKDEEFVLDYEGVHTARSYETEMNNAIHNYVRALTEAQNAELSCGPVGGSSHGALECFYRLHASRFKALLYAIKCAPSECELAELEAFRIVSTKWYIESHASSHAAGASVREKMWDLYVDCVEAFNHCREEVQLFHRAVYRLCQAYNYAPLFHDPNCDLIAGSKQAVPASISYKVRGLDTDSCAESATVIISKLFDKRRSQLCSVWVTTSAAPSPFEVINDSFRKYDALRMKYILAFVECMRVCKQVDGIETLLNWTSSSEQDLPGFYEASASLRGLDPGKHTKQSYLSTRGLIAQVKQIASNALAEIILSDLAEMKRIGISTDGRAKLNSHFQLSYRLFLLLNSSCKEVVDFLRMKNRLAAVDAFGKCFLAIRAGYRISSIDFEEIDSETMRSILEGASAEAKTVMQVTKTASSKKEENKRLEIDC